MAAQRRGKTFAEAWEGYAAQKVKEFSTEKYRAQWRVSVETYALPEIGAMAVQDVALQDIQRILAPIWESKTVTASKLRQKIEGALNWATVQGYRAGDNPARWRGNLDMVLPAPGKVADAQSYPSLQLDDVSRWWQALQGRDGMGAAALRFQALTATRAGAIRFAAWSEIDLQARMWTIQPGRKASKTAATDRPKRIPLTDEMVALLEALPRFEGNDLVFPAPRGGALSDATLKLHR
ncbi:MAG: tyrosine-type recombinase/integrase [Roseinatronobacter sp.]